MAVVRRGRVWQVQVRTHKDAATGKWHWKYGTRDTRAEALKLERAFLAEAEQNGQRWVKPTDMTLGAYLKEWLERQRTRLRPGTVEVYGRLIRLHIIPNLGDVALPDVSPPKVQALLDTLGPCRRTEQVRTLLRTTLGNAVKRGMVADNAGGRADAPHYDVPKRESFTLAEADAVLHEARNLRLRHLFALALFTGLRRGELCGLQWPDVDLEAGTMKVRRQIVRVEGRPVLQEKTKTEAGARTVPLIDKAKAALTAQRAMVAEERLSGRLPECQWVFPTLAGKHLDPDYVTDTFERIAKRAGTEKPLHAMRHATASILLGAGVPPAVAAKIMGHASLAVFYKTYADLLEPAAQEAARQVERFLAAAAGGRTVKAAPVEPARRGARRAR